MPGVIHSSVSLSDNTALVTFNPNAVTPKQISDAIYSMGFDVNIISVDGKEDTGM